MLTFVIPVRHPDNARSWGDLTDRLRETAASIAAQTTPDWAAVVIANHGAQLPPLPPGFTVERVDFPPNDLHEREGVTRDMFLDAFRIDKGRRVMKGMLAARDSRYFMIVDDDDFVSARLTAHVAAHDGATGWMIDRGYVWGEGGRVLYAEDDFNHMCGSSLIVRADLYDLPARFEDASPDYMMAMLGSHYGVGLRLRDAGTPLESLPFRGAVYRIGSRGSHSGTPGIWRKFFLNRQKLRRPHQMLANLSRLRPIDRACRREFFGRAD